MNITILQIVLLCLLFVLLVYATRRITQAYIVKRAIDPNRKKLILNIFNLIYFLIITFFMLIIFGIEFKQVIVFASSILAILGVGFFAQWSMLSNLTASIILFFYHPMRIGNTIRIIDKEYDLTGVVKNITGFYVLLYVEETKRQVIIPNIIILYRGIELIEDKT